MRIRTLRIISGKNNVILHLTKPYRANHLVWHHCAHEGARRSCAAQLLAAVTDLAGEITGLQRTWLARDGSGKAPFDEPRRAMGHLLGNAVRFGEGREPSSQRAKASRPCSRFSRSFRRCPWRRACPPRTLPPSLLPPLTETSAKSCRNDTRS